MKENETQDLFDELLSKLNETRIIQTGEWIESIPDEIYEHYIKTNYETIALNLDIDKHRWYETSMDVIGIFGRYLGIRHVSQLYSEQSSIEDICWKLVFKEVIPIKTVTFKVI